MTSPRLLCVVAMLSASSAHAEGKLTITVSRQYRASGCTSGYLAVNGKIIVYALERAWLDNVNDVSSIPAGTYKAHLRYDKKDHWRIQLDGVPKRTGVQIHVGNEPEESKGCLLVGAKLGADLCSLQGSQNAYTALKRAFSYSEKDGSFDPREIEVTIEGSEKPPKK